ncbi:MAG: hypothetical protein V7K90_26975 [Nostoc sp.]
MNFSNYANHFIKLGDRTITVVQNPTHWANCQPAMDTHGVS